MYHHLGAHQSKKIIMRDIIAYSIVANIGADLIFKVACIARVAARRRVIARLIIIGAFILGAATIRASLLVR